MISGEAVNDICIFFGVIPSGIPKFTTLEVSMLFITLPGQFSEFEIFSNIK